MAGQTKLIKWFVANQSTLNANVSQFTWSNDWVPGLFDYEIQICWKGQRATGRGLSFSESEAVHKAISESYERLVIESLDVTDASAAHLTKPKAQGRARHELYERISLRKALADKLDLPSVDLRKVSTKTLDLHAINTRAEKLLSASIRLFQLPSVAGTYCCIAVPEINESNNWDRKSLGVGVETTLAKAARRAFLESLPNLIHGSTKKRAAKGSSSSGKRRPATISKNIDSLKLKTKVTFRELAPKDRAFPSPPLRLFAAEHGGEITLPDGILGFVRTGSETIQLRGRIG